MYSDNPSPFTLKEKGFVYHFPAEIFRFFLLQKKSDDVFLSKCHEILKE